MVKVAFIYDFDQTLSPKNMQEYSLLPLLKADPVKFWSKVGEISQENNMDSILAYMYLIVKTAKENGIHLTKEKLIELGKDVIYYPGVETFFDRINAYGKERDVEIEHYIISSGTQEILEGTSIYSKFKKVYGCKFHYDENGYPDFPALAINYTGKTQFLFRINKNSLDVADNKTINIGSNRESRDIPFNRMVYIADGFTDVPCMQLVKNNSGYSIAVSERDSQTLEQLIKDKRINYVAKPDYSEGSELDQILKSIIDKHSIDERLSQYQK